MTTLSQLTSRINTEAAAEYGVNGSERFRKPTLYGTSSALVSIVSGRVRAPAQIIVEDDHDALGQRPGPNDRFC
jgi:hypothetical protein